MFPRVTAKESKYEKRFYKNKTNQKKNVDREKQIKITNDDDSEKKKYFLKEKQKELYANNFEKVEEKENKWKKRKER